MIPLALTVLAATAAGFGAEHRMGERADDVAQRVVWLMLWVLGPPITFLNLAALELRAEVGAGIAFAYAALLVSLAIAWALGTFVLRLPRPAVGGLMLVAAFANTGYLGLPFVAAVFGLDDLPDAVAYDVVLTTIGIFTIGFSVGAAFGTRGDRPRERVMAFFAHNPVVWAALAGFLAPSALAPQAAVDVSQIAVFALLPLGFFVVGVTLASEAEEGAVRFPPPLTPAVGTALALKLLLSPAIVLGLSAVILRVPGSYLAQAAMASAINCIVVARTFGLDRGLVASAIAWSTAIVVAAGLVAALL
jgi:malate permease and related proteins